MKKKGFTLIELLAVIIILAIIALITVPVIMNIIEKANKSAFKDTAYGIIKSGELYYANKLLEPNGMNEDVTFTFPEGKGLDIKGSRPKSGDLKINKEGKIQLAISNGKYCIRKKYNDNDITIDKNIEYCGTIIIEELILEEEKINALIGETKRINVQIKPEKASKNKLKYTSLDENIVTVTQNGEITIVGVGNTKIIIETIDGSNIKKEITITSNVSLNMIATTSSTFGVNEIDSCINDGICENGTAFAIKVNDTETYKFYVISDTGKELELIMDRNLGGQSNGTFERIAWITEEDYKEAKGTSWDKKLFTNKGPLTLLKQLDIKTKNWTNIPAFTYKLNDDSGKNLYPELIITSKARLLTMTEANNLGCSISCPDYLKAFTHYWLSTATDKDYARAIQYNSKVVVSYVVINAGYAGIRPVIKIPKNI